MLDNRTVLRRTAMVLAVPAACAGLIGVAQLVAPSTSRHADAQLVDTGGAPSATGAPAGETTSGAPSTSSGAAPMKVAPAAEVVRGTYLLRGPASVPAGGSVLFVLQGPKRVVKAARTAPFTVRFDTRTVPDGTYQLVVSTVVGEKRTAVRTARLVVANRVGGASPNAALPTGAAPTGAPGWTARPSWTRPAPSTSHPATRTATTGAGGQSSQSSFAAQVVALTNQQRAAGGCQPLGVDSTLTAVALAHSQDMAANNYFDHNSQNGRSPFDRMTGAGYQFRTAAENIAAGQRTPQDVVTAWMNSAGHKANIMDCSPTEIGVGYATGGRFGTYWTQDFGTPR